MEKIVKSEQAIRSENKRRMMNIIYIVLPAISLGLLVFIWMRVSQGHGTFPSPAETWERFIALLDKPIKKISLWQHIGISLQRVLIALLIAWLLGISLGILLGWNKKACALINPIFTAFRAVPPLAWIPLITIWFGTGEVPKILVVFIGALMPVVVNTQAGMSTVNRLYLDVGTIFQANGRQTLFQIAIPSALDAIFAGIRTSASAAWMVVLAAEMLGAKAGIGFLITRGMESGDEALVLLSMICIGIAGALIAIFTEILEGVFCPWKRKKSS